MLEREEIGRMTEDEFFRFIQKDLTGRKYEYVDGLVYAMAGATFQHDAIVSNLNGMFYTKLRGTRCRALSHMVHGDRSQSYLIPDLMIFCGKNSASEQYVNDPTAVIEVLSKSTRAFDRGEKRLIYQQIPSLREYLLVYQDRQQVERWARNGEEWDEQRYTPPDGPVPILSLPCGDLELPFDLIYEGCEPPSRVKEEEPPYITGN